MASYIVLSPPDGEVRDERNRIIKDGFSFLAALFPFLWALSKRLYLEALVLFAVEAGIYVLGENPRFEYPAIGLSIVVALLWGFEARNWQALRLEKAGWRQVAIIVASSLGDAEAMFYGNAAVHPAAVASGKQTHMARTSAAGTNALPLGLMDYEKGRF